MSEIESKKSINVESILVYRYQGISPDELFLKTSLPSIWNGDDFNGSDGYGEIYAIRKITRRGFFDDQKPYVVKYDKDFESDKFTLLGFCQTKKLVDEYIRKLEREFCND